MDGRKSISRKKKPGKRNIRKRTGKDPGELIRIARNREAFKMELRKKVS